MKISDLISTVIPPVLEAAIYNTPEYTLSSSEHQHKAFTAYAPELVISELFKTYNEPLLTTVKVKLNTGEEHEIPVKFDRYGMAEPDEEAYNHVIQRGASVIYMLNSSRSPLAKKAVYFTKQALRATPELQRLSTKIAELRKRYYDDFQEKLKVDLRQKLSPAAKAALEDNLLELINDGDYQALHSWFKKHEFENLPPAKDLKKLKDLKGWNINFGPDRWGHQSGSYMTIDWASKKFKVQAGSSD